MNNTVRFRLTASQLRLIGPGLQLVASAYAAHRAGAASIHRHIWGPMAFPPDRRGSFDQEMMEIFLSACKTVKVSEAKSMRLSMSDLGIRALIFATRIEHDRYRQTKHHAAERRRKHKQRVATLISTLERILKRAVRRAVSIETGDRSQRWREHLKWLRSHLVHFRPERPLRRGKRGEQIRYIDRCVVLATRGLSNRGYEPPDPEDLRILVRLKLRYRQRLRPGHFFDIQQTSDRELQFLLEEFVLERRQLFHKRRQRNGASEQ